ncbi:MAG: DUF2029 domain-containing protein [Chloroflexi bacterium]|nr:DUF2029 domain-containing protein [Chloroflexota bacterium]
MRTQWLRRVGYGFFLFLYLAVGWYTFFQFVLEEPDRFSRVLLFDYHIYERAVAYVWQGRNPYHDVHIGTGFLYPPVALLFLNWTYVLRTWPLAWKASIVWAGNLLALGGLIAAVMRHYHRSWRASWWWYALLFSSAPFWILLMEGQINVWILLGLLPWVLDLGTAWLAAGWLWATGLKLTPAVLLLDAWRRRRYRVVAWALLGGLGLTILVELLWPGIWEDYLALLRALREPVLLNSSAFVAKLYAALPYGSWRAWFRSHSELVLRIQRLHTAYVLALVLLSQALGYVRARDRSTPLLVTLIAFPLLSPVFWVHHYVFWYLPLLFWWAMAPSWRRRLWVHGVLMLLQADYAAWVAGLPWSRLGLVLYAAIHGWMVYLLVQQIRALGWKRAYDSK